MEPIIIVSAMTQKGHVIGKDNWLPWDIPEELAHFRNLTSGGVVIMGRNTWESIGRPMPNRVNIVVSTSMHPQTGIKVCTSLEDALTEARKHNKPIYLIGGRKTYKDALSKGLVDKMYLSFIKQEYDGDTHFPDWNEQEWETEKSEDKGKFVFTLFSKKKKEHEHSR